MQHIPLEPVDEQRVYGNGGQHIEVRWLGSVLDPALVAEHYRSRLGGAGYGEEEPQRWIRRDPTARTYHSVMVAPAHLWPAGYPTPARTPAPHLRTMVLEEHGYGI